MNKEELIEFAIRLFKLKVDGNKMGIDDEIMVDISTSLDGITQGMYPFIFGEQFPFNRFL